MSGTSSCCQVMSSALTANSSDHEECNSSSYLFLWHSRIHDERCSANGGRQIARKERRHFSVKMTHEEGRQGFQPTKPAVLHDFSVSWHALPWPGANRCDSRVCARWNTKYLDGTMTRKFDLIAIGTGSAASGVTSRFCEAGWKVAIVDSRPFGGTCALRGCDPKKVLVGAAEAVDWTRRMKGRGIQAAELQIDWPELMRFKRSFTEPVTKQRENDFAKAGIAAFHGRARFAGPTTVQVGDETLEGRYVVIAAGEAPTDLGIPGAEHLTTSDQFLS